MTTTTTNDQEQTTMAQETQVMESTISTRFCDSCDSKANKHKKNCLKHGKEQLKSPEQPSEPQDDFTKEALETFKLGISRIGQLETIISALSLKVETLEESLKKNTNVEFERELKKTSSERVELSATEQTLYGASAPNRLHEIVGKVLGVDFMVYAKSDERLPQTFITVHVPSRLAENSKPKDLRSRMIPNVAIEHELKKFCELIKKNIFRQFQAMQSGSPEFLIN